VERDEMKGFRRYCVFLKGVACLVYICSGKTAAMMRAMMKE